MGENKDSSQNPVSDDESGLELSLGLSCGGFFSKTKGESSVQPPDIARNVEKAMFEQQHRQVENQQTDVLQKQSTAEMSDQTWEGGRKKRQRTDEQSQHSRVDIESDKVEQTVKTCSGVAYQKKSSPLSGTRQVSPLSGTRQDGSSADNEDTADSEFEASSSKMVSVIAKENLKQQNLVGSNTTDKKENPGGSHRATPTINESNQDHSSVPIVNPVCMPNTTMSYSFQSFPIGHVPYGHNIQVSNNSSIQYPTGFSLPYVMQLTPGNVNGVDRTAIRPINSSGFHVPLGYSSFQLPTLETPGASWFSGSHSNQPLGFGAKTIGRASAEHAEDPAKVNQAAIQVSQGALGFLRQGSADVGSQEGQKLDMPKSFRNDERQLERSGSDVASTSLSSKAAEDDGKGQGSTENLQLLDALSQEFWNIRPGIAPGLKFGGSGNSPDLPWVSTTGPGPNGKTISGVLYRYNRNQLKIVCACHGRHMLPAEFLQHASGTENTNSDSNVMISSLPNGSHTTSAQG